MLVENWTFEPEAFALIKERADIPDLGALIDTGHLNLYVKQMGKGADEYIEALPLEIHELHLHDNDGVRDYHLPLYPRQGSILPIMGEVVSGLKKKGFDGIVTLEVIPYGQRVCIKDEEGMASIIRTREIFEDAGPDLHEVMLRPLDMGSVNVGRTTARGYRYWAGGACL